MASRHLFLVLLAISAAASAASYSPVEQKAGEVIQRTKTTRATYAVYNWNRIEIPGHPSTEEWSAEFHSGSLHRVETPRDRVVADCQSGTGSALSLMTGQIKSGPEVALYACGINTAKPIVSARWVGKISTHFGSADRIEIVDRDNIRTYDVSDQGVILDTEYRANNALRPVVLEDYAVAVQPMLPDTNMFDEASLGKSFVPDKFKHSPAR